MCLALAPQTRRKRRAEKAKPRERGCVKHWWQSMNLSGGHQIRRSRRATAKFDEPDFDCMDASVQSLCDEFRGYPGLELLNECIVFRVAPRFACLIALLFQFRPFPRGLAATLKRGTSIFRCRKLIQPYEPRQDGASTPSVGFGDLH